jgi:hypothetical protein
MLIDVTQVKHLEKKKIEVSFADGLVGVVDVDAIVNCYDGVFEPLKRESYFAQVYVNTELGTIAWPNGADLCPDVLYAHASGKANKLPIF